MLQCRSRCVRLAALHGRCFLSMFLHSFWGPFLQREQFMQSILVRAIVHWHLLMWMSTLLLCLVCVPRFLSIVHIWNYPSTYRGHTHLLWWEPDGKWREGHSWYLCHLSCTVPVLAGWIHWPGSHETRAAGNHCHHYHLLYWWVMFVCALGVWNSHAAALPHGSDRPEEQTGPSGQRACHSRSPGVAHWNFPGQQQRLCHQPHQRHRT